MERVAEFLRTAGQAVWPESDESPPEAVTNSKLDVHVIVKKEPVWRFSGLVLSRCFLGVFLATGQVSCHHVARFFSAWDMVFAAVA